MDLSKLESVDDLKAIVKVGDILVNTYYGINQEPIGYEDGVVLYPDDFHIFFKVEKFNEESLEGKEWDDFNQEPSDKWISYCYLDSWEIYNN